MTRVKGETTNEPSGRYWYWTELGPENVNMADKTVDLPPGRYEVLWDFRGQPGDKLEFKLTAVASGIVFLTVSRTIPSEEVDDWGGQFFTVPK